MLISIIQTNILALTMAYANAYNTTHQDQNNTRNIRFAASHKAILPFSFPRLLDVPERVHDALCQAHIDAADRELGAASRGETSCENLT